MPNFKKINPILILISLIIFHGANNYLWLTIDTLPPNEHEVGYLWSGLMTNYILKEVLPYFPANEPNNDKLDSLRSIAVSVTPSILFQIISTLFGTSLILMRMSNTLFFGIMLLSTYAIGEKMFNKNVGLMSAFLLSMYPIIFGASRIYTLDIAEMAILCSCIYFLMLSNYFQNFIYSILFGISFGLGMITKIMFPVYIFGPLMFYLYMTFIHEDYIKKKLKLGKNHIKIRKVIIKKLTNFSISGLLGILPFLFLFLPNIKGSLGGIKNEFLEEEILNFNFKEISFYIFRLVDSQIFLVFSIIFIIAFIFFIKTKPKNYKFLIFWIIIPIIILTLGDRTIRHSNPILPAMAIISSYFIFSINNSKLKRILVSVIVIFSFLQFFVMSYSSNFTDNEYNFIISPGSDLDDVVSKGGESRNIAILTVNPTYINHPAKKEDWKIKEILDTIEYNTIGDNLVIISSIGVDYGPFSYHRTLTKRFHWIFYRTEDFDGWHKNFENIDFILLKKDYNPFKEKGPFKQEYIKSYNRFEKNKYKFKLMKEFKMPDDSTFVVYKKK